MKTKISKLTKNYLKEASELNCCLHHVQIYVIYVEPNHISVVDAFVYYEFLSEHPSGCDIYRDICRIREIDM